MSNKKWILSASYQIMVTNLVAADNEILNKGQTGKVVYIHNRESEITQAALVMDKDNSMVILGEHLLHNGSIDQIIKDTDAGMSLGDIIDAALAEAKAESKISNKLSMRIAGNDSYRLFYWNKRIELMTGDYSYGDSMLTVERNSEQYGISHPARMIYDMCSQINLVTEVSVKPYEMSIQIVEGFEEDMDEWGRIIKDVCDIIQTVIFKNEDYKWNILDKSAIYKNQPAYD